MMPWCTSKARLSLQFNGCCSCFVFLFLSYTYILHRNGAPLSDMDEGFESGTEITFNCIKGAFDERSTWKIVCVDGAWIGKSSNCGNHHEPNA